MINLPLHVIHTCAEQIVPSKEIAKGNSNAGQNPKESKPNQHRFGLLILVYETGDI